MEGRGVAWLAYVPVPGLAFVPALAFPASRLARYHAWQGGALVAALYVYLLVVGLLSLASDARGYLAALGALSGLGLGAAIAGMLWGIAAAALGRFDRIRPAWELARAVRRDTGPRPSGLRPSRP